MGFGMDGVTLWLRLLWSLACAIILIGTLSLCVFGQAPSNRKFAPEDDVGLTLFEFAGRGAPGGVIKFSPDGRFFAVLTERGNLQRNAPEDTIWVFQTAGVLGYLRGTKEQISSSPVALVKMATEKDGPIIEHVTWLPDSSGIAFTAVQRSKCCRFHRLFVATVKTRSLQALTPEDQDVTDFDIRGNNYVYQISPPELLKPFVENDNQTGRSLVGRNLDDILFHLGDHLTPFDKSGLWAVIDGHRLLVRDAQTGKPFSGLSDFALSPDGHSLAAILNTNPPNESWRRYKAPPGYEKLHLPLDTGAYYLIDLHTGIKRMLVDAPTGRNQDWHSNLLAPRWSADGQSLILPNTFLPLGISDPKEIAERENHPWIAVLRMGTGQLGGVLAVRAGMDKERYAVNDVRFEGNRTVVVDFDRSYFLPDRPVSAVFREADDGSWKQIPDAADPRLAAQPVAVRERESIDLPPVVLAADKATGISRIIWDPNPQLRDIAPGSAEIIRWKDSTGYEWEGGLVKPPDYKPGKRYPLVIQTHGFSEHQFLTNGSFTTAFAARALAAHEILVVQIGDNPNNAVAADEALDQIVGFESLVAKLAGEGMIDPARVGIIGFSRTVYHVLAALAANRPQFAAASVTDGVNFGYFEYLLAVDTEFVREADAINGGKPFEESGLKNWLARSPEYNMGNVRAPLLLLQPGIEALWADWEPYAALRYLHKPVDLIMVQAGTHVMSNPLQRLASEKINVDWFRFWLKDEEDPDPAKRDQYDRWRELRKLQEQNQSAPGTN